MSNTDIALFDLPYFFRSSWHRTEFGEGTKVTRETTNKVLGLAARHKYVGMCVDSPPYRRKQKFPQYKANREPATSDMNRLLRDLIARFEQKGYPIFAKPGYEADDMIASVCAALGEQSVTVYTGDKDLLQLVSNRVSVAYPAKNVIMSCPDDVFNAVKVLPEQIPLYLAICGDTADNLPGMPNVGKVKAPKLIDSGEPIPEEVLRIAELIKLEITDVDISTLTQERKPQETTGSTDKLQMKNAEMVYRNLSAPFPIEAIERTEGKETNKGYNTTGIKYQYVVNRFNEVLGIGHFRTQHEFKVFEKKTAKGRTWFEVICDLSIQLGNWRDGTFVPYGEAFGTGGHSALSLADAKKGAYTNGFKKVAAFFGVGRQAYEGSIDDDNLPIPEHQS